MTTVDRQLALALHYLEVGRPGEALRVLDDMPSEMVAQPEYWLIRSGAHFGLGEWEEGSNAAQRGLALDPEDTDLLNIVALCQLENDQEGSADKTLFRALAIEPENPVLLANRALVLARMREFPEAHALIDKAVGLAPWSAHVATVRVQVAMLAGDPGVQRLVDELLAQDPENQVAHALLAPLRVIWRVGWFPARVVLLGVFLGLNAAGFHTLATAVIVAWLGLLVFSWTAPRYLRWRMKRRYGGF